MVTVSDQQNTFSVFISPTIHNNVKHSSNSLYLIILKQQHKCVWLLSDIAFKILTRLSLSALVYPGCQPYRSICNAIKEDQKQHMMSLLHANRLTVVPACLLWCHHFFWSFFFSLMFHNLAVSCSYFYFTGLIGIIFTGPQAVVKTTLGYMNHLVPQYSSWYFLLKKDLQYLILVDKYQSAVTKHLATEKLRIIRQRRQNTTTRAVCCDLIGCVIDALLMISF